MKSHLKCFGKILIDLSLGKQIIDGIYNKKCSTQVPSPRRVRRAKTVGMPKAIIFANNSVFVNNCFKLQQNQRKIYHTHVII